MPDTVVGIVVHIFSALRKYYEQGSVARAVMQATPLGFASPAAHKPRVVFSSGWGGNKVARYLDKSKFDVRVVPGKPFSLHARPTLDGRGFGFEPSKNRTIKA